MALGVDTAQDTAQGTHNGELQQSLESLGEIETRIRAVNGRLKVINDRAFSSPQSEVETANNEPRAVRPGQIGGLRDHLDDAHAGLSVLEQEVDVLERL